MISDGVMVSCLFHFLLQKQRENVRYDVTGRSADVVIAAYYVDLIRQHSTAVSEVLKKFQFLDLLDSLSSSKTRAQEHDCKLSFASTV